MVTKMRKSRRAVLVEPHSPIEIWEGEVPPVSAGEVLISVQVAGVCGTDHHLLSGEVPLPCAIVLGHEGIGHIEELGPEVCTDFAGNPVAVGDLVYWMPMRPCQRCHACNILNDPSMCTDLMLPMFVDAEKRFPTAMSYTEFALLPAGMAFFKVPADVPADAVIAFGCAMPTMLNAIERLGGFKYGQDVVVQGCGPVGLAATLLARLGGAASITVVGAPAARLDMAARFGATSTIDISSTDEDERVDAVKEATGGRGAPVVIEAAGQIPAFGEGLRLVAPGGSYLVVGLWSAPGTTPVEPRVINNDNLRIIGSALASPRHVYQAVEVARFAHKDYPFNEVITHRFGLDQAQAAIDAVGRAEPLKAVIIPAREQHPST